MHPSYKTQESYKIHPSYKTQSSAFLESDLVTTVEMKLEPIIFERFLREKYCRLVRSGDALISPYFPETWTGLVALMTIDLITLRLRKLVYCN